MILLDFEIDEAELAENLSEESDPQYADSCSIVLSYFIMPVRIRANEKDFFAFKNINKEDPWIGIPIVNLAIQGFGTIKLLPSLKKVKLSLEEVGIAYLELMDDDRVRVLYEANDIDEIVKYTDIYNAFEKFAIKVKKFLNERVPKMRNHKYWGPWVRGEEE